MNFHKTQNKPAKLNAVLKILEKQGWLTYSDAIKSPTRLMVTGRPSQDLLGHYPEKDLRGLLLTQLLECMRDWLWEHGDKYFQE